MAAIASAVAAFDFAADIPFIRNLELVTLDARFQVRGPLKPGPDAALIVVDEAAIAQFGRPPFSRAVYADAVRRLAAAGPRVIAMDLLFTEAERPLADELRATAERIRDRLGATPADDLREDLDTILGRASPDRLLAQAIADAGNVVVPFAFSFDAGREPRQGLPDFVRRHAYRVVSEAQSGAAPALTQVGGGALIPLTEIGEAAASVPFVNVIYDSDGTLRYEHPALTYGGQAYPSLPFEVARLWHRLAPDDVVLHIGRGVQLGERVVPADQWTRVIVNYRGRTGTIATYSFGDLVAGRLPAEQLAGKAIFVGVTAIGFSDTVTTPFDSALPRVERYAQMLDMILQGDFITRDEATHMVDRMVLVLVGLSVGLACAFAPTMAAAAAAALATGLTALGAQVAFQAFGVWLHVVGPMSMIVICFIAVTVVRLVRAESGRRAVNRQLRISEERYTLAARGANDGLWDWDLVADRLHVSDRWRGMMGVGDGDVGHAPQLWFDRVHPDDLARLTARLNRHLTGKALRLRAEFRVKASSGRPDVWILARGLAVRDKAGRALRIAGSCTDITSARKNAEALRSATIQAEAASRAKSEFLARMSHELRTPLNAIIGFSDMMDKAVLGPISARYRGYAGDIGRSGRHLLAIVSDILDISKIEAGRVELRPTPLDVSALIRRCVEMVQTEVDRLSLAVDVDVAADLPPIIADEVKLRQILLNLLSNAVKFSRPGGCISVSATLEPGQGCRIAVTDRGIGIAPEDIDRVTEPFNQGIGVTVNNQSGTGLGLAIARALVESHRGTLRIESQVGVGTTVTVTLPADRAGAAVRAR
jgi:PAS domain S-box-containing protein